MNRESFLAAAWNNGQWSTTGAGYGLKVSIEDRDRFFDREWESVTLRLGVDEKRCVAEANVAKASFWDGTCREMIKKEIGFWFIECGFAPWPKGEPPQFQMFPMGEREFQVEPL